MASSDASIPPYFDFHLFSHIIANPPYYSGAYNLVGQILLDRGRLDESIKMYSRALEVDSNNKDALKGRITASIDIGNLNLV